MHDDRSIVEARLRRVTQERIAPAMVGARLPLGVSRWEAPGEPVPVAEALAATYEPFEVGHRFGRPWGTTWFRLDGTVPAEWAGSAVDMVVDLGFDTMPGFQSEGLLWGSGPDGDWVPVRGVHPEHTHVPIADPATGGERVDLLLEAASNPRMLSTAPNPNSDLHTAGTDPLYALARAELVVVNPEVVALRHDIRTLHGLMGQLSLDDPRRHEILRALDHMLDRVDLTDVVGSAAAARGELAGVLSSPASASAHRISAVGHAHIDSAWLWPLRETVRKCARTFSNVLDLMDRYPEMRFACSQAQQYEWMRERYPSIFEGIRRRVAEGRWIPVGGMWVEADANLAGGEALIRQITHGQRYFEEHFGVTCTEVWIPDVFGYPAGLPGIMAACGIDRFLTQKLSWNRTNKFPHHTFWWEGLDGSTVFTHFPPVDTYNANFSAFELAHAVRNFADKGAATRSLMPFGHGDGGGGPTPEMLEQFRRVRDLESSPRVEIESPSQFFDAAVAEYPDAARWVGELYFEMHRGTFTSQARTKAGNRRCEQLLAEAEMWSVAASSGSPTFDYPAADLDRLWKEVLLLQFHDILPGSSIGWVHREAEATHERVAEELGALIEGALGHLAVPGTSLANPAPHRRRGVVVLGAESAGPLAGSGPWQSLSDGGSAGFVDLPASSVVPVDAVDAVDAVDGAVAPVVVTPRSLDNGVLRVELDDDGLVVSLVELASGRQVVAPGGRANLLQLHPDLPNEYDAWDVEAFYRRTTEDLVGVDAIEVLDAGPLVGRIGVTRSFGASTVTQVLELRAGSRRLDVTCDVDWHEREKFLKVAFPLDLHTAEMTREVQFGHLTTAIHTNTSWDEARFEVCAHRWAEVAEPGFGVALLNDGRYGYDATRTRHDGRPSTTLRLSLLRGPRYPDPEADQGRHRFRYALMAYAGDRRTAGVVPEAAFLNLPVRVVGHGSAADPVAPVVVAGHPAVVVEAVKEADDGSGDLVVRVYESWGARATCPLRFGVDAVDVRLTDARERPLPEAASGAAHLRRTGTDWELDLRPFQIVTIRVARSAV